MLTFEEYCECNSEELYISAAESGADREYDYDAEAYAWQQYNEYMEATKDEPDPWDSFYANMPLEDTGNGTIYGADTDIPF